jgi:hypothetical protein
MQRPSMEARASAHSSGPLASRCGGASGSDGSMRAKQFLWRRVSKALRWVPAAARVVGGQHSGFGEFPQQRGVACEQSGSDVFPRSRAWCEAAASSSGRGTRMAVLH